MLSYVLAFLAPAAIAVKKTDTQEEKLPEFKPRWWYSPDRLDARPVVWSLKNRPHEWNWRNYALDGSPPTYSDMMLTHVPSQHHFWIGSAPYHYPRLDDDTICSCATLSGRWQMWQNPALRKAIREWVAQKRGNVFENFASHFVRPVDAQS